MGRGGIAPALPPAQQRRFFREFCENEIAAGGPDPHMKTVVAMNRDAPFHERVWRSGVYAGVYNVPAAEFLWRAWPLAAVLETPEAALEAWLRAHWAAVVTRRERRCVRRPEQLARYFKSFAAWARARDNGWGALTDYEAIWNDLDNVYTAGRYFKIKLLQCLALGAELPVGLPDLRPAGGENPRQGLALLVDKGEAALLLGEDESPGAHKAMNNIFYATQAEFAMEGLRLDAFHYQTLLCDYKQSYLGKRQYPGRSLDSELDYYRKIAPVLPSDYRSAMFDTRARIFPRVGLGEAQGWPGVRETLGAVLRDFGYTWSDARYDYLNTLSFAVPALRTH